MTAWYVVYTHPNAEARALGHLLRQGYTAYLPRYGKQRRHARKLEQVRRPLFPRYLFVAFDAVRERWRPILSTVGVAGLVRHGEAPASVPPGVVEAIRAGESGGAFDEPAGVRHLCEGDRVRVLEGPFADLVGRFCGLADADRVVVLLDMLGRPVRARMTADAIAPA